MPDTIDRRIVEMRFDNKDFEKNIGDTLISLETLKRALEMNDSGKGLENVARAAERVDLSGVQNGVEQTSRQFSAMEVVAITALANITNSAVNAGKRLVSSFVNPLISGGKQRAMNMAQAKFMFRGLGYAQKKIGSASEPNTIMGRIYKGVEGTFYSLDRAALVASQLMASGMKGTSEELTKTLKSIAGISSMFGADYDRVGQIFSKIKAVDRAMGGDLTDLAMYGVPAAQKIADYLNEVGNTAEYTQEKVQDMASEGKIDFKTFSAAFESYGEQAAKSKQLFTGAFEDMVAAMGRVGEKFWDPLLNNLARDYLNAVVPLIDNISGLLGPAFSKFGTIVGNVSDKISGFIDILSAMVNYDDTIEALKSLAKADVIKKSRVKNLTKIFDSGPLKAFKLAVEDVRKVTDSFSKSVNSLRGKAIGPLNLLLTLLTKFREHLSGRYGLAKLMTGTENIIEFVKGIRAITDALKNVLSNLFGTLTPIKDILPDIALGITYIFRGIGILMQWLAKLINESSTVSDVIEIIRSLFASIAESVKNIPSTINQFFSSISDGLTSISSVKESVITRISNAISSLVETLQKAGGPLGAIANTFKTVFTEIKEALSGFSVLDIAGAAGIGSIGFAVWNIVQYISKALEGIRKSGGIGELFAHLGEAWVGQGLNELRLALIGLQNTLTVYQNTLKAGALLFIASAILELAIAVRMLSNINPRSLATATAAIGALMWELTLASGNLKATSTKGIMSLAFTVRILAGAVKKLADLDPEGLSRGLMAILSLIGMLVIASERLADINGSMAITGSKNLMPMVGAMIGIAFAVKLLIRPIKQLARLSVPELAKGLISVGLIIGLLAGVMILFSKYMDLTPDTKGLNAWLGKRGQLYSLVFTILMLSAGVGLLVLAVKGLGAMDTDVLKQGLISLGVILAELIAFFAIFEAFGSFENIEVKGGPLLALGASMILIAAAMNMLIKPVKELGALDIESLEKGLASMAIMLAAVAGFLAVFQFAGMGGGTILAAAASLAIMAISLNIMAAALNKFSSIEKPANGLIAMATALAELALAMYVMQGSIAGAGAMIIAAAAIAIMAPALALLSKIKLGSLALGILALGGALLVFGGLAVVLSLALIPMLALAGATALLGLGVLALGTGIGVLAAAFSAGMRPILDGLVQLSEIIPTIATNLAKGLGAFLDEMANLADSMVNFFITVGQSIIEALVFLGPQLNEAALDLLINLLETINSRMEQITILAVEIVVAFINGLASKMEDIAVAGFNLIIGFFNGVANAISEKGPEVRKSLENVLLAVIQEVVAGIPVIGEKGAEAIKAYREGLMSEDVPADAKKIADDTGKNLKVPDQVSNGENSVQGIITGMDRKLPALRGKAKEVSSVVDDYMRKYNQMHSPSRRLAKSGRYLMLGLISGIDSLTGQYQNRANNISSIMVESANSSLDSISAAMNRSISPAFDMSKATALTDGIKIKASGTVEMERQESLISQLNAMVSDLGDIIQSQETDHTFNFTIPFDINGRELARAQATYTQEELDRAQMRENRKLGVL